MSDPTGDEAREILERIRSGAQPADPQEVLDDVDPLVEAMTGVRAKFIEAGFTPKQAGDLVVESFRLNVAQNIAALRPPWGAWP